MADKPKQSGKPEGKPQAPNPKRPVMKASDFVEESRSSKPPASRPPKGGGKDKPSRKK